MHKTTLYIGSPNGTGKMDAHHKELIRAWASDCCPDGYTLLFGEGGWRDTSEETAVLILYTGETFPDYRIQRLREALGQRAILVERELVETTVIFKTGFNSPVQWVTTLCQTTTMESR